jgi:hypothetical protein
MIDLASETDVALGWTTAIKMHGAILLGHKRLNVFAMLAT